MSDFSIENKVVQANELIKSVSKLDLSTMKIFEMAVSCIDTSNPPNGNTVVISKKDIFQTLDFTSDSKYSYLKTVLKKLIHNGCIEINLDSRVILINITNKIEYDLKDNNDKIYVEFHRDLMPYLIDLKKNFTQYSITEISQLKSKYSVILFKWLMMNYNQRHLNSEYTTPRISMNDLRKLTDTEKEYKDFRDFEKRVLKNAIDDINEKTSLNVSYAKLKDWRTITHVQFQIDAKTPQNASNEPIEGEYEEQQAENQLTLAGTYGNVCLTHEEFKELLANGRKWAINEVSEWKSANGVTTYKNTTDYQLCNKWNKKGERRHGKIR